PPPPPPPPARPVPTASESIEISVTPTPTPIRPALPFSVPAPASRDSEPVLPSAFPDGSIEPILDPDEPPTLIAKSAERAVIAEAREPTAPVPVAGRPRKRRTALVVVLLVILGAGAGAATYFWPELQALIDAYAQ
ncbi:MAG TPA: hypothetical protein VFP84_25120, partial [Kofleriaceae bacterium]|nr:hypothetical protein [Kofleriaceae bacterium]